MKNLATNLSALFVIAITLSVFFISCKNGCANCGETTLQKLSISRNIQGVIIEGSWDVSITQDSTLNSAVLEYCECKRGQISSELLENGYLHIKVSSWGKFLRKDLKASIKAISLEKVEAKGAASIHTSGHFGSLREINLSGASTIKGLLCDGQSVRMKLNGASTIKSFRFEGNKIDVNLSGASEITIDNLHVEYCNVDCSGSSSFHSIGYAAKSSFTGAGASIFRSINMESEDLEIELSGASIAEVSVNYSIKGKLSGASVLEYKRAIDVAGVHLSGGSRLKKLD